MTENMVTITSVGLSKIAGATVEQPLILEKFVLGDGQGEVTPDATSLISEKYRDFINDKYSSENNIVLECVLRGNAPIEEGFYIRELGILDVDGDLIAIVKTPEQYRPALQEGVLSENIFSVVLKIENTENIVIQVQESIFATVDALSREVTSRSEGDNNVENKLLEMFKSSLSSQIGHLVINVLHKYKHAEKFSDGYFEYLLCDGRTVAKADYPELFECLKLDDRPSDTIYLPNFDEAYPIHMPTNTGRPIGAVVDYNLAIGHEIVFKNFGVQFYIKAKVLI